MTRIARKSRQLSALCFRAAHEAPAAMAVGALGRHRRTLLDRDRETIFPPDHLAFFY